MRYTITIIAILALLVACAPQEQPEQVPQQELPPEPAAPEQEQEQPEQPEEDEPEGDSIEEVESGLDAAFGPRNESEVITIDDVSCDRENGRLTFRFRNLDDVSWQLNQDIPFPPPSDMASVKVMVNQYEANGISHPIVGGEEQFGPEERFSENCQGVEVLEPGEEVTCTLEPVPIRDADSYGGGVNEIFINGPAQDGRVRFRVCE